MSSLFTINSLTWGMSSDSFYGSKWQAFFLENANIDEMRYVKIDNKYVLSSALWAYNETILAMKETPYGVMQCGYTKVWLGGWDKSATVAWAYAFEYFGEVSGQQKNVFIQPTKCITTNGDVSSIIGQATFTAGTGYGVSASVSVYGKVIFANDSTIYEYDPLLPTTAPVVKNTTIPYGSKILHMYFYNDMLYVVTRLFNDTIIYSLQYVNNAWTTAYSIYSTDINKGYTCLGAIGDGNSIFWVTPAYIMQFSGGYSQKVSTFWGTNNVAENGFVSSPHLHYWTGFLYVSSWSTVYRYGSNKPWRSPFITSFQAPAPVSWITQNYIHGLSWSNNNLYVFSNRFHNTCTIITLPYDAGIYGDDKDNLSFRVGYKLPLWVYTGTQCSLDIGVMTDYMEMNNTVNFATVASITNSAKQRQYVTVWEINNALANAWYSPEWQYIRFKIVLKGGNEIGGNMTKTPIFFDIKATHNTIKDELQ